MSTPQHLDLVELPAADAETTRAAQTFYSAVCGWSFASRARLDENVARYRASASVDIRVLLIQYTVSDSARRVVGVGSVGTLCGLVLLQDGDGNALVLQAKQAGESVLIEHGGIEQPPEVAAYITEHGEAAVSLRCSASSRRCLIPSSGT